MSQKIFSAISYIFHPLFMPILGMWLILYSGTYLSLLPLEGKRAILLITALSTILLPLSVLPFLYYQKLLTSYKMPERKERLLPLLLSIVFYYFGYYILRKVGVPSFIQHFLLASIICLVVAVLVHLKWKISTHMIGVGGILGLISSFSHIFQQNITIVLMFAIIIAGAIGTARLYLKAHNQAQVYSGFMVGFILSFVVIVFMNT